MPRDKSGLLFEPIYIKKQNTKENKKHEQI